MSSAPRPIPRPFSQRWRDFRVRFIPVLTYLAGVGAIIYLWNTNWMPGTFTGEVQAVQANVDSAQPGLLSDVTVRQFDPVTKGQVLGKVTVQSSDAVKFALAAVRADLEVTRARMTVDQHRNEQNSQSLEQNYQQLLAERMRQKVELDSALFDLRFLESDLVRTQQLRSDEFIATHAVEVKDRQELLARLDEALAVMKPAGPTNHNAEALEAIEKAIQAQEDALRQSAEVVLRAPIDGIVTKVSRNNGENITAGEPLIIISATQGDNIVGYVRQPISFEPKVGDTLVVRSRRGTKREAAEAKIIMVGGRLELFAQALRVRGFDSSQERGLPVLINIPQNLKLYPGELVDLALKN